MQIVHVFCMICTKSGNYCSQHHFNALIMITKSVLCKVRNFDIIYIYEVCLKSNETERVARELAKV